MALLTLEMLLPVRQRGVHIGCGTGTITSQLASSSQMALVVDLGE